MKKIIEIQNLVLAKLAGKLDGFYLAGGTALSLFYFHHRESYDLDFFTQEFSRPKIEDLVSNLAIDSGCEIKLVSQEDRRGFAKMLVYILKTPDGQQLKIDFVEDANKLLMPLKEIDNIPVFSIEDIYLRKIFTACGSFESYDETGRQSFAGGRQEAKDFFDLYFLSTTFMPLSKFAGEYCSQAQTESIIVWFRSYDRLQMKIGLKEIITDKKVDFSQMERHFKIETARIMESQI